MHCSAYTVLLLSLKNRSISAGCSQSQADVVLIGGRYQMTCLLFKGLLFCDTVTFIVAHFISDWPSQIDAFDKFFWVFSLDFSVAFTPKL